MSLAAAVAKEVSAALGVPVRIGSLRLSLFTGSVVLRGIRIGAASRLAGPAGPVPLLHVVRAEAKPLSLVGADRRLRSLRVDGWTAHLEAKHFARPLPRLRGVTVVGVDELAAFGGTVSVGEAGGGRLLASGVRVSGSHLSLAFVRGQLRPAGKLVMQVRKLAIGSLVVTKLRLELQLGSRGVTIRSLAGELLGGKFAASGHLALRRNTLGPLRLSGTFASPDWRGRLILSGAATRLALKGALERRGARPLAPRGRFEGAPRLRLDLRVGRQRVHGRLDGWRLR